MLNVVLSNQFKRDLKLAERRGYDLELLTNIVDKIALGEQLDLKYRDHNLTGKYTGFRECHIQPDWLLIYRIDKQDLILLLFRTGSHSDLL